MSRAAAQREALASRTTLDVSHSQGHRTRFRVAHGVRDVRASTWRASATFIPGAGRVAFRHALAHRSRHQHVDRCFQSGLFCRRGSANIPLSVLNPGGGRAPGMVDVFARLNLVAVAA